MQHVSRGMKAAQFGDSNKGPQVCQIEIHTDDAVGSRSTI
jgi:hypothetical protein